MFKIRADQLVAVSNEDYPHQVTDFLREQFPDAADENPDELLEVVRDQLENGRSYGFFDQRDLAVYVTTAWLLGADFDTCFPAANAVLNATNQTPGEKSEWLSQFTQSLFEALEQP